MKKNNDKMLEYRIKEEEELRKSVWRKFYEETVVTGSETCDACPYVVYGQFGERRCYMDTWIKCQENLLMDEA